MPHLCEIHYLATLRVRLVLKSRRLGEGTGNGLGWDPACRAVGNQGGERQRHHLFPRLSERLKGWGKGGGEERGTPDQD